MDDIITVRCPSCGNTYNVDFGNGNTFKCSHCGNTNLIRPNLIHNPYRDGYEEERGRIDARRKEQLANASQNNKANSSMSRKKPRVGKVIAIIICVVVATQILPMIISLISDSYTENSNKHALTDTAETRIAEDTATNTNSRSNGSYNEGIIACSFPDAEETSEQTKWIYLTDLTAYSGFPFSKSSNTKDIFGNEYNCSLQGYRDDDSAIWRLNYEYTTLVCTIGVPSICRGANTDWYSGSLRIYCDDVIVYEKSCIDSLTESEIVTIDVSNTKDLKIQICADYCYLEPAVFDPILYK